MVTNMSTAIVLIYYWFPWFNNDILIWYYIKFDFTLYISFEGKLFLFISVCNKSCNSEFWIQYLPVFDTSSTMLSFDRLRIFMVLFCNSSTSSIGLVLSCRPESQQQQTVVDRQCLDNPNISHKHISIISVYWYKFGKNDYLKSRTM